jgi:hypothetical protein
MASNLPISQHRSNDQEMDTRGSEPSENGNEIHSREAQHDQSRCKPPPGRIENILKEGGIPQSSAAGPSGTVRSQKIDELYDVFSKIRKKKKKNYTASLSKKQEN